MLKLLADTSFLIYITSTPSPLLRMLEEEAGGYQIIVPTPVLEELQKLAERGGQRGRRARAALEYARRLASLEVAGGPVDEALLSQARARGLALATLDRELLRKAQRQGLTTITARRGRLLLEGPRC